MDQALRRLLADRLDDAALAEGAQLMRASIEGCAPGARVLYAAHTALPWPHEPHRMVWHASTLLREHRGDSHNLALAAVEVDGVQAHILMAARGQGTKATILPLRGWTPEEWEDGVARLVARGCSIPTGRSLSKVTATDGTLKPRPIAWRTSPFAVLALSAPNGSWT